MLVPLETKNRRPGEGDKDKHNSYVGDTSISILTYSVLVGRYEYGVSKFVQNGITCIVIPKKNKLEVNL